jgi:hypothetical protein
LRLTETIIAVSVEESANYEKFVDGRCDWFEQPIVVQCNKTARPDRKIKAPRASRGASGRATRGLASGGVAARRPSPITCVIPIGSVLTLNAVNPHRPGKIETPRIKATGLGFSVWVADKHRVETMRLLLIAVSIVSATILLGPSARAQNYPWCAHYSKGDDGLSCAFVSFEQCMETVRGIGGFCMQNNTYQAPLGPHPSAQRRRLTQRP